MRWPLLLAQLFFVGWLNDICTSKQTLKRSKVTIGMLREN